MSAGTGAVYTASKEEQLPMAERTLYMGIAMHFDCTIQVPEGDGALDQDLAHGHRFSLEARPAASFTTQGATSASAVYGAMASTAFDDFRDALIRSYGLDLPTPSAP